MSTLGQALDELAETIAQRAASGDASSSYTAQLLSEGVARCAKKFGEEAVEAVLAAVSGDKTHFTAEAGDVIYTLLVLVRASGVSPAEIAAELQRRAGTSGLEEKASRKQV